MKSHSRIERSTVTDGRYRAALGRERRALASVRRRRHDGGYSPRVWVTLLAALTACQEPSVADRPDEVPPPVGVTLEQSIGEVEGPSERLFHGIMAVVGFEDGGFWVLDGGVFGPDPRIRSYSARGDYLGEIGRRGEGPGEFLAPYAMTTIGNGRVVVRDRADPRRLSVFSQDGVLEESWAFSQPLRGRAGTAQTLVRDADGVLWVRIVASRPGPERSEDGRLVYVRIRPEAAVIDTVASPLPPELGPLERIVVGMEAEAVPITIPFQAHPILALTPHGRFAVGATTEYSLRLADPVRWRSGSDPVRASTTDWISRTPSRVPVSDPERRAWAGWVRDQTDEPGRATPAPSALELPSFKPPIGVVHFDDDGRTWIRIAVPAVRIASDAGVGGPVSERAWSGALQEPQTFDVFDLAGEVLGRVVLPSGSCRGLPQTFRSLGDHLWCVHWDESRIESVRRYHLAWP